MITITPRRSLWRGRLATGRVSPAFAPIWTPPRNLFVFPAMHFSGAATVDPVLIQKPFNSNASSGLSTSVTWTSTTTAGNLLIACVSCSRAYSSGSAPVITAPAGWTEAVTATVTPASSQAYRRSSIYYKANASAESGAQSWSCTGYMSTAGIGVVMAEYSGMKTASPLDVTSSAADTSTTSTTCGSGTTASTAQARELAIACLCGGSTLGSAANSFTLQQQTSSSTFTAILDKLLTSIGTPVTSATFSTGIANVGCIATFKVNA